jgi:DNA invertase Pin-like site-specific DNA recombinase
MPSMNIGYARVSTLDQTLALQEDALHKADCKQAFRDAISGAKADRPGLQEALDYMCEGDTFIVWRLDCLTALRLHDGRQTPVSEIWRMLKMSRAAFYKRVLLEGGERFSSTRRETGPAHR